MRIRFVILAMVVGVVLVGVGVAIATPASGVTADTARGTIAGRINIDEEFENGSRVRIKTKGPMEFAVQRIVAVPGATFGWHRHPAGNVNVVQTGTLTLYHDENCTQGIDYGPGAVFTTGPDEIHLARNNGTTDLILFATYYIPRTTPAQPIRIDVSPKPGAACPE